MPSNKNRTPPPKRPAFRPMTGPGPLPASRPITHGYQPTGGPSKPPPNPPNEDTSRK